MTKAKLDTSPACDCDAPEHTHDLRVLTRESSLLETIDALKAELAQSRRSEEGWRRALDASNQGAWSADVVHQEFFYCEGWRRMRGIPNSEILDTSLETWIDTVHPDDRDAIMESIEAQNSGLKTFSVAQYRERHRAGHWIWIESRSSIMEWQPCGRAARVVGTDADITERKAAEQALADMSRKLSLAIEVAGVGIFDADLETGVVHRDRRLLTMYGVDADTPEIDPTGNLYRDLLHPHDRDECLGELDEGIASGQPFESEFRILTPKSEIRHLRSRAIPFTDHDGKRRLLGVNWDVTNDMRNQEVLRIAVADAEARSEALEKAKEIIRQVAIRDELTGLLNRRGLTECFSLWRTGYRRFSAILHLDLDGFKAVNDELGHHAGDQVLRVVAARVKALIDQADEFARWGGDEFVLICGPGRDRDVASKLADDIIRTVSEPIDLPGGKRAIGVSIGIAEADGDLDPDHLLMRADGALYQAKARGRGRAVYAAP